MKLHATPSSKHGHARIAPDGATPAPPGLVSQKKLAEVMDVHPRTIQRLTRQGVIPFIQFPGTNIIRYDLWECQALLQSWKRYA